MSPLSILPRLFFVLLLAARPAAADDAPAPRAVLSVEAVPLTVRQWRQTVAASGPVAAWQDIDAGAVVGGLRVTETLADVGSIVKKGQLLARLDASALRISAAALRADLSQARALAEQARAGLERAGKIAAGGLSEQDLLDYRTRAATSEAQAQAAAARLAAVAWQIDHADVRAPDDGQVEERLAAIGAVPAAGQPLFRMIRDRRLEWRGQLDARQLGGIAAGQQVALTLPDGSTATARVRLAGPAMNAQNRLGTVYADIDILSGAGRARAGMYADGVIALAARPTLTVPAAAVFLRDGHSVVAQVLRPAAGKGATVRLRTVRTGQRLDGLVEIVAGLAQPALVVAQGGSFLADGDAVDVVSRPPAAPAHPPVRSTP